MHRELITILITVSLLELLNADIPTSPKRRKTFYGAEPMVSEVTQEETNRTIMSPKNWKTSESDDIPAELINMGR